MIKPEEICVLAAYDETYNGLAEITVYNNINHYCEMHGYHLEVYNRYKEDYKDDSIPYVWYLTYKKLQLAHDILKNNKQFKWIFYIDTDSLIMNKDVRLESFLDDNYSFLVLNHKMPAQDNPVTTMEGVHNVIMSHFFVKNSEDGLDILNAILTNKGWPENIPITEWDLEGRQVRIIMNNPEYTNKIKALDENKISKMWYVNNPFVVFNLKGVNDDVWQPGDFIVHTVGYPTETRRILLSDLNYFSGLQR